MSVKFLVLGGGGILGFGGGGGGWSADFIFMDARIFLKVACNNLMTSLSSRYNGQPVSVTDPPGEDSLTAGKHPPSPKTYAKYKK